ncbi:MAG: hypothetical protein LBV58_01415 [Acholeplasmatales bacterium]|jgi:hypothetical protein|nr:hypothetical protein [Acholeplasmatales bacterium]
MAKNYAYVYFFAYELAAKKRRMKCWIEGRRYDISEVTFAPFRDTSLWEDTLPYTLENYKIFYAQKNQNYSKKGSIFIEYSPGGKVYGRLYRISREQLEDVQVRLDASAFWYGKVLDVGEYEDYQIKALTCKIKYFMNTPPSKKYLKEVRKALSEAFPSLGYFEISRYLNEPLKNITPDVKPHQEGEEDTVTKGLGVEFSPYEVISKKKKKEEKKAEKKVKKNNKGNEKNNDSLTSENTKDNVESDTPIQETKESEVTSNNNTQSEKTEDGSKSLDTKKEEEKK